MKIQKHWKKSSENLSLLSFEFEVRGVLKMQLYACFFSYTVLHISAHKSNPILINDLQQVLSSM